MPVFNRFYEFILLTSLLFFVKLFGRHGVIFDIASNFVAAERRAQLSRTRSRQDLFDDDVTGYNRVLDKNPTESKESGVTETVTAAMERVRRCPKNSHDDEFQAEQILARLRQL